MFENDGISPCDASFCRLDSAGLCGGRVVRPRRDRRILSEMSAGCSPCCADRCGCETHQKPCCIQSVLRCSMCRSGGKHETFPVCQCGNGGALFVTALLFRRDLARDANPFWHALLQPCEGGCAGAGGPACRQRAGNAQLPGAFTSVVFCCILPVWALHGFQDAVRYHVWQHSGLYICGACL